jgi:hypothetical protein
MYPNYELEKVRIMAKAQISNLYVLAELEEDPLNDKAVAAKFDLWSPLI